MELLAARIREHYEREVLERAGFVHHGLEDLTDEQIQSFIQAWFAHVLPDRPEDKTQSIERINKAIRIPSVRLLAGNPMLLTVMAIMARVKNLPEERVKFHDDAVKLLVCRWDVQRRLHGDQTHLLTEDQKTELLRRIAYAMQKGEYGIAGNAITETDLIEEVAAYFENEWRDSRGQAEAAAVEIVQRLNKRNHLLWRQTLLRARLD